LLSLPAGTEMFHFPALPRPALCVQAGVTASYGRWVSPFGNPRITVWLPTPRGLSQAPTSFIGSWCQGIHRAPLKTWQHFLQMHYKAALKCCRSSEEDARVHCAVLKIRTAQGPATASAVERPCPSRSPRAVLPTLLCVHRPVSSGPNSVLIQPPCLAARSVPPGCAR
jgi:hypothetical protein